MWVKPIILSTICHTNEIPLDTTMAHIPIRIIKSQFFAQIFLKPKSESTSFAFSPLLFAPNAYKNTLRNANIAICTTHEKNASESAILSAEYISKEEAIRNKSVHITTTKYIQPTLERFVISTPR